MDFINNRCVFELGEEVQNRDQITTGEITVSHLHFKLLSITKNQLGDGGVLLFLLS